MMFPLSIHQLEATCLSTKDPVWRGKPTIIQLSPENISVSWKDKVKDQECADKFFIEIWRTNTPRGNGNLTGPFCVTCYPVCVDVLPEISYTLSVNAYEEKKGLVFGNDDNWSNKVRFQTRAKGNTFLGIRVV